MSQNLLTTCSPSASLVFPRTVKRFWQILALFLLTLMVPASVCCLVPQAMEDHQCDSCSMPEQQHDAPAQPDACPSDTIEHSQLPAAVVMPEMQMVEVVEIIRAWVHLCELAACEAASRPSPSTAPPELRTKWVFVSRAALPARAPSELA